MKKLIFSFCFLIIGMSILKAQPINKATPQTMLKTADEQYEMGAWYDALEWYEKSYKELKDTEVAHRIAELNYKLRDYRRAESWYKRVLKRDKKGKLVNEKFVLGRVMKMNGNYDDAVEQFESFISLTDDPKLKALAKSEMTGAELAKEMQAIHGLTVKHGGKKINSHSTEASPVLSIDGANVYFSSIQTKEIIKLDGSEGDYFTKIYMAGKKDEDNWDKPKALNQQINRPNYHTGNPKLTPDGNTMFFTRTLIEGDQISESKIHLSNNSGGTWGPARELIGVNGAYIAKHPAIGELFGDEVLFFVSDMDGGYGGDDIYYAKRKSDDVFGDPINLGPNINTEGDEISPFYKDGNLYFSSTGHPGIGGFDIFNTIWNGDTWSRPQNMGIGYNSSVDDMYFMIDQEGYNGFLVSNREGTRSLKSKTCCDDIFQLNIAKIVADLKTLSFEGKGKKAKALTGVNFQLIEMLDNTEGNTDAQDSGEENNLAAFDLGLDIPYRVIATKAGYFPDTLEFNTVGLLESTSFEKKLYLKKVPPPPPPPPPPPVEEWEYFTLNEAVRLNRIYYDFDDDKILAEAEIDLQLILDLMNKYPEMKIEMASHTDAQGTYAYNEKLSQRRADSATKWLVGKGIASDRIVSKGYGETQILNRCTNQFSKRCSDEEHRFNRRTVFTITEGPKEIKIKKKRKKTN